MICKSCKYYTKLNDIGRIILYIKASAIYSSDKEKEREVDNILSRTCKHGLRSIQMNHNKCTHYKRKWWMFWR